MLTIFFRTEWDYIARTRTVQTHFIGAPMNLKVNTRSAHKRPPFFFISGTLRRPSHRQVRTTWWEADSPDKDPHATTKAQLQALESAAGANDDEPPRRRIKYDGFHSHMQESLEFNKTINLQPYIQIKFELHHYLLYDKIFKTGSVANICMTF